MNIMEQEITAFGGIEKYLYAQQQKVLLRFLTCGGVDDGKSTLIGRLLYDSKQIYDDQLSILHMDSKTIGTNKDKLDLSLLVDGLQSERAQGITIDVAYRYFFTQKRKFIIADTPGHEEYTKNMVTGASNSEVAVLLIDARKGVRKQTRRHCFIVALLGIRYIIVAINKMDLVGYDQKVYQKIREEYLNFTKTLSVVLHIEFVPIAALDGDNIVFSSINMHWYNGSTLLNILENINIHPVIQQEQKELRFPVQYVIRDHLEFRGYAGTIEAGSMIVGQSIKIFPSDFISIVRRIIVSNEDRLFAFLGEAVTIVLEDDLDVSRGDLLMDSNANIFPVQSAWINVVWMSREELKEGQYFNVKIATKMFRVVSENIQYQVNIQNLTHQKSDVIPFNGIGLVKFSFNESLILDQYSRCKTMGSMIFIDPLTNVTVGAGMVSTIIENFCSKYDSRDNVFELELRSLIQRHFPHWNCCMFG